MYIPTIVVLVAVVCLLRLNNYLNICIFDEKILDKRKRESFYPAPFSRYNYYILFMIFNLKNKTKIKLPLSSENGAGFTLIEIIVAISILSFGILLVYNAFSMIVNLTYNISSRFTAAYLAQEGLEIVKNLRDNNYINNTVWSTGLTGCTTGCQADYKTENPAQLMPYNNAFLALNDDGFYSYDAGGSPTIFTRKITINNVLGNSDILNVDVLVSWSYRGQSFSFDANEYLYNWN